MNCCYAWSTLFLYGCRRMSLINGVFLLELCNKPLLQPQWLGIYLALVYLSDICAHPNRTSVCDLMRRMWGRGILLRNLGLHESNILNSSIAPASAWFRWSHIPHSFCRKKESVNVDACWIQYITPLWVAIVSYPTGIGDSMMSWLLPQSILARWAVGYSNKTKEKGWPPRLPSLGVISMVLHLTIHHVDQTRSIRTT